MIEIVVALIGAFATLAVPIVPTLMNKSETASGPINKFWFYASAAVLFGTGNYLGLISCYNCTNLRPSFVFFSSIAAISSSAAGYVSQRNETYGRARMLYLIAIVYVIMAAWWAVPNSEPGEGIYSILFLASLLLIVGSAILDAAERWKRRAKL